ncbi:MULTISPECIES: hypothetical protein [unclassified Streptomyces]|uniref:hypothetical protein n=1 Tax=unclassified Streptomyces TaxID=2593676 RepID=UPI0022558F1D|nr:hypothetical protein [Streptomyces sp. NBC_00047]MCX5607212.1 hypothetical protein [Streptomyces sp. NBC_00047]
MARDYDSQLLESVAVRRRRMRDALLFGAQRARRTADERLGKLFAGIAIAAVLCAGCVGWSFVQHTLAKQKAEQQQKQQQQQQSQLQPLGQPSKSQQPSGAASPSPSKPPKSPKTSQPTPSHTAKSPKPTQS